MAASSTDPESDRLREVLGYHEATKHHFGRYARGPHGLDWDNQPDPFLRYLGAPLVPLQAVPPTDEPRYEAAHLEGGVPARPLDRRGISQLFADSLALSAWKQAGPARWSLRINPSSGNLHPTEGYLVCGPIEGLTEAPMVAHYAPREHALERRAEIDLSTWEALTAELPPSSFLVGLTSIHWREAWKYGERAFRYCQHDVGHAIAALVMAAAGLGWRATLVDDLGTREIAKLLGVHGRTGPEAEAADCVLVIETRPATDTRGSLALDRDVLDRFGSLPWQGEPTALSPNHVDWPWIDRVAEATVRPPPPAAAPPPKRHRPVAAPMPAGSEPISLRAIIRQRRSAVAFDGRTGITRDAFYQALQRTIPRAGQVPFGALGWAPCVHLALFVHRVADLPPGIYCLVRNPSRPEVLRAAMDEDFEWAIPEGCPPDLPLFRLRTGDARRLSAQVSCHQAIAADGCFSLGMIAELQAPLAERGAWFYRRLFWECGVIGQVLYLEAEALGIRGTGIGCFFDDPVHEVLGLRGTAFQSLYHFTVGGPVEDPRLRTLPPYPEPDEDR